MVSKLFDNYRVKLVALSLAIFIWLYVVTEEPYEYALQVPVVVTNLHEDRVVRNDLPERATVLFRGSGKSLIGLMVNPDARIVLDLSRIRYRYTFRLTPDRVRLTHRDPELTAVEVLEPDTITVLLAEKRRRTVPVLPQITVEPAKGYRVNGDVQVSPDSVRATGPKDLVDAMPAVPTQHLVIQNARKDIKREIDLQRVAGDKIKLFPDRVQVFVDLQKVGQRKLTDVPVEIRNHPRGVRVECVPGTLSITLEGAAEVLDHLQKEMIVAYVDYRHWSGDPNAEIAAYIETPPGVSYREVNPSRFRLLVEKEASE